jgi:hypothetical protein
MNYVIADGSTKDILEGDMIQVIEGILPYEILTTDFISVVGVPTYALQISIVPQGKSTVITTDLSAAAVTSAWRRL